mgnify:CR=1 FL=1
MTERFDRHTLDSGMVLLAEPMEGVESAAFGFMLPAGAATLPDGCCGAGTVITDWIMRGAGERDSRQLGDELDGLGLHRVSSVGSAHITIGSALEATNLPKALDLYADIILRPRLTVDQFEPARQLAIDGVLSLDDDPRHKVMLKLREQFYRSPLGRSTVGHLEELENLTAETTSGIISDRFDIPKTIMAVAGKYDFDALRDQVEKLFGTASGRAAEPVSPGDKGEPYTHIQNDGAQVHIGLMTETITPVHERYYDARVAVSVLSGGMSARLFTEVREKRGLCYAIGARYHSLKDAAGIACYAGTTPDKAQETFDVIITEFKRLAEGITQEELDRSKTGLKSSLILQSESSSSRAGAIASDYYMLGRIRTLDEIKEGIEATTIDSVLSFLNDNKFEEFTVVTIGPKTIEPNQS